jgi:starch phosphorylase
VREYTEQYYLPAASAYHLRATNRGVAGTAMATWQLALDRNWNALHFGQVNVETDATQHAFEVQVYLEELEPGSVEIELYADGDADHAPVLQKMERIRQIPDVPGGYVYGTVVPAERAATRYTARLIPHREGVATPLEDPRILWQR